MGNGQLISNFPKMSATTEYAKSVNGLVHVVNPCGGEHTLCGDAFDINSEPDEAACAWKIVKHGPVTCFNCASVIEACRGVRINVGSEP